MHGDVDTCKNEYLLRFILFGSCEYSRFMSGAYLAWVVKVGARREVLNTGPLSGFICRKGTQS